jgi:hypothetical protein
MPSTFAIKHQIRKLMIEDEIRKLEEQLADSVRGSPNDPAIRSTKTGRPEGRDVVAFGPNGEALRGGR